MTAREHSSQTAISNEVIQHPFLDPIEFRVYAYLASLNPCSTSMNRISRQTGISRRGAINVIARLEEKKVIEVMRLPSGRQNQYRVQPWTAWLPTADSPMTKSASVAPATESASRAPLRSVPDAPATPAQPKTAAAGKKQRMTRELATHLYHETAKVPEDSQGEFVQRILTAYKLTADEVSQLQAVWHDLDEERTRATRPGLRTQSEASQGSGKASSA